MQAQGDIVRAVIDYCHSADPAARADLRDTILALLDAVPVDRAPPERVTPADATLAALAGRDHPLATLDDARLSELNAMLPWGAMTAAADGRLLGSAWNATKRTKVEPLLDNRLRRFNKVFPLAGRHVLEVGCFEGIHTIGCLTLGARVTAVDARMENVLKTLARLWAYGHAADVRVWDLESPNVPAGIPDDWDMLHHIGVLYHLTNPAENLALLAARTRHAILLDTHVADAANQATERYEANGRSFAYARVGEKPASPFAGLRDHAKWLLAEDLEAICRDAGFTRIEKNEVRPERNGARAQIWAFRE